MSQPAHPRAMEPSRPGRTRTAPPELPPRFPFGGRYRAYTLFDATGILYLALGFLILRVVWALGDGATAWDAVLETFRSPVYIAFHLFSLLCVVFVAVRFFGLFPRAQPPRIGPVKPPPQSVILAMLYVAWIGATALFAFVLTGGLAG